MLRGSYESISLRKKKKSNSNVISLKSVYEGPHLLQIFKKINSQVTALIKSP